MFEDPFGSNPIVLDDAERAAIQAWVDAAARRLALPGWVIVVTRHASEPDAMASSFIYDEADRAYIAVSTDWRKAAPEELRHALTHELLHPHFQRVTRLSERLVEAELGKRTEAVIDMAVHISEEQSIDRLARAIAGFLPLVEIPTAVVNA